MVRKVVIISDERFNELCEQHLTQITIEGQPVIICTEEVGRYNNWCE